MGFFSGSTKLRNLPEPKPLGLDEKRLASSEQARPVPLFYGRHRLSVLFLTQCFNLLHEAIKEKVGKSRQTVGFRYFVDFAALVGHGSVDEITAIHFDNELVWSGTLTRSGDSSSITIPDLARWDWYWGTESQGVDSKLAGLNAPRFSFASATDTFTSAAHGFSDGDDVRLRTVLVGDVIPTGFTAGTTYYVRDAATDTFKLAATAGGTAIDGTSAGAGEVWEYVGDEQEQNVSESHPAYKRLCYLVADRQNLGDNRTNVQNIEVTVGRYPDVAWLTAAGLTCDLGDDCNLAYALADVLTNSTYGLGLASTKLDQASFIAFGQALKDEGFGVSPLLNAAKSARQWVVELLEYVDGYYYMTREGKLAVGLARDLSCVEADWPVVDEACLIEPPRIMPEGWSSTRNRVYVRFENADNQHKEDEISGDDMGNYAMTGQVAVRILDRPWLKSPAVAAKVAQTAAKMDGWPTTKVELRVSQHKLPLLNLVSGWYDAEAVGSTDVITVTGWTPLDGTTVFVRNLDQAALPSGLYTLVVYYVVNASGSTCKLSLTAGGSAVDIGDGDLQMGLYTTRRLEVGDGIRLCYGHLKIDYLRCRILGIHHADPRRPEMELDCEADKSRLARIIYTPPTYSAPLPVQANAEDITHWVPVELPWVDKFPDAKLFAVLAARGNTTTDGFRVLYERTPGGSYGDYTRGAAWAVKGKLSAQLTSTASSISLSTADDATCDHDLDTTVTASAEASQDVLIGYITDGTNDELVSLYEAATTGGGAWTATLLRGRYDTLPRTWSADTLVYVIRKTDLERVTFELPATSSDTKKFKVRPYAAGGAGSLTSEKTLVYSKRAKRWWCPKDFLIGSSRTPSWASGGSLSFAWSGYAPDGTKIFPPRGIPNPWRIRLYETNGTTLIKTLTPIKPETESVTFSYADMTGHLGSHKSFIARLDAYLGSGLESRYYDDITVTQV